MTFNLYDHFAVTETVRIVDGKIVGGLGSIVRCSCGVSVDGADGFMAHRESVR